MAEPRNTLLVAHEVNDNEDLILVIRYNGSDLVCFHNKKTEHIIGVLASVKEEYRPRQDAYYPEVMWIVVSPIYDILQRL